MLTAVDTGMIAFMRSLFPEPDPKNPKKPKYTVVYAPEQGSRQALANINKSSTIGVPGLSIWRSDIAIDYERYNMPLAARGFPWARDDSKKQYKFLKAIPVSAVYTIRGWSRGLTDLTYMERKLAFCHIYKTVKAKFQIPGDEESHYLNWPIWTGDLDYDPVIQKETGKVVFHSFKVDFEVDTWWVEEYPVPWIEQVKVNFYEVLDGDPVGLGFLDSVNVDLLGEAQYRKDHPKVRNLADSLKKQRTAVPQPGRAYNEGDPDYPDTPLPTVYPGANPPLVCEDILNDQRDDDGDEDD